jgi:hypothetical protein
LPLKSLIVDYQQDTKSLIFAIFATKGNLARKYCKIRVKKTAFSELVAKKATSMPKSRIQEMAFIPFSIIKQTCFEAHLLQKSQAKNR